MDTFREKWQSIEYLLSFCFIEINVFLLKNFSPWSICNGLQSTFITSVYLTGGFYFSCKVFIVNNSLSLVLQSDEHLSGRSICLYHLFNQKSTAWKSMIQKFSSKLFLALLTCVLMNPIAWKPLQTQWLDSSNDVPFTGFRH